MISKNVPILGFCCNVKDLFSFICMVMVASQSAFVLHSKFVLAGDLKLQKEKEKAKAERKKERKREKKEKRRENKEKAKQNVGEFGRGEKRKLNDKTTLKWEKDQVDLEGRYIQKSREDEVEQLEKSGLTEEH